jgi:MYXO-CTERM domain-containing protein
MSWTDEDQHDPGITFLELLAWVLATLAFFLYVRRRRRTTRG